MSRNLMSISFASVQERKDGTGKFLALQGQSAIDGKLLETEVLLNLDVPGSELIQKLAEKYRACFDAGTPDDYPRGFALEAPNGWAIDWDQEREPYEAKGRDGQPEIRDGRWVIRPIRATEEGTPSIRLTKMPPVAAEADKDALELAAKYGF